MNTEQQSQSRSTEQARDQPGKTGPILAITSKELLESARIIACYGGELAARDGTLNWVPALNGRGERAVTSWDATELARIGWKRGEGDGWTFEKDA